MHVYSYAEKNSTFLQPLSCTKAKVQASDGVIEECACQPGITFDNADKLES